VPNKLDYDDSLQHHAQRYPSDCSQAVLPIAIAIHSKHLGNQYGCVDLNCARYHLPGTKSRCLLPIAAAGLPLCIAPKAAPRVTRHLRSVRLARRWLMAVEGPEERVKLFD
jgi:hypothetical protein